VTHPLRRQDLPLRAIRRIVDRLQARRHRSDECPQRPLSGRDLDQSNNGVDHFL
jgi:hypothetical protein